MTDDPVGHHCSHRLFEWMSALGMLAFGVHIFVTPAALSASRYNAVLLVFTTLQFALACIIVAGVRLLALLQNGKWTIWGPIIRAVTAAAAAAIWAQLAVSLAQVQPTSSPGMWIYLALAGAEVRSVWRARRDANGPG